LENGFTLVEAIDSLFAMKIRIGGTLKNGNKKKSKVKTENQKVSFISEESLLTGSRREIRVNLRRQN